MKRNISNILMLAFLLLGMTACEVETLSTVLVDDNGNEELTFSFNARATATNENESSSEIDLNEDKIETLDLFFFNANGEDTYLAHHQFTNANSDKNTTYTVNIPSNGLDMNGNTQYRIYAVANRVITTESDPTYTLNDLKSMTANKVIGTDDNAVQASFVMDGEITTALSSNMTTPVINLARSVAKITLDINVADELVIGSNNVKYTPVENSMTVRMIRGVKEGIINGFTNPVYFEDANGNPTSRSIAEVADGNDHTPFYSYPYDWSSKSTDDDCYLYLTIDWLSSLGNQRTYYYIVPIGEVTQLVRNNHYKINLNVAILGGTEDIPVTLRSNYIIENWSTREISTELKKYKYLWVKGSEFVMNNVDEIKIDFASSSTIDWENLTVKRYVSGGTNSAEELTNINNHGVTFTPNNDGTFSIKHTIKRTGTGTDLNNYYRPWYIEFDIKNEEGLVVENIKITQYPAIYAVADYNGTSTRIGNTTKPSGYFNRFVNGVNSYNNSNNSTYGGVHDISAIGTNASNTNRNQYVITVTNLGQNTEGYIIGDPRAKTVNNIPNNNTNWSASGTALYGESPRQLTHYYPTQQTNVDNMIAPKFRIASSWGVTNGSTYTNAQRRCASYQENGYPAGRWRIPTEAEIKFVNGLSADGYIPELFDGAYFASSGRYWSSNNKNFNNTTSNQAVRCVYDEWYWGSTKIYNADGTTPTTTFTWGDEPITQK